MLEWLRNWREWFNNDEEAAAVLVMVLIIAWAVAYVIWCLLDLA